MDKPIDFIKLTAVLIDTLVELNYSEDTIASYKAACRSIGGFLADSGATGYSPASAAEYREYYARAHGGKDPPGHHMTVMRRLDDIARGNGYRRTHTHASWSLESIPEGFRESYSAFIRHSESLGNSASTLWSKRYFTMLFTAFLDEGGCRDPSGIEPAYVARAAERIEKGRICACRIASMYLRFLAETGRCERDFSVFVPKVKRSVKLPTVYSREEREKVENSPDPSTAAGKRDRCILLLVNRLAMRASNVARLRFSEVDFERNMISFSQAKVNEPHELPLLPDIRDAMLDYVGNGRPESDSDFIFLQSVAPYDVISGAAVFRITSKYLDNENIDTHGRRTGPGAFRSSDATAKVNGGMSYEMTRKSLGHKSADAIKSYAKLDIDNLRKCASEVPQPSGYLLDFLRGKEQP